MRMIERKLSEIIQEEVDYWKHYNENHKGLHWDKKEGEAWVRCAERLLVTIRQYEREQSEAIQTP